MLTAHPERKMHSFHDLLDVFNWPVILASFSAVHFWDELWQHWPTPTACYTVVTTLFMLFQMADKLGWLDRFKTKRPGGKS